MSKVNWKAKAYEIKTFNFYLGICNLPCCTRPIRYHTSFHLKLIFVIEHYISDLRIFEYALYVPIAPPQFTEMGPQRRLRIYKRYLDYHYDESFFLETSMRVLFTTSIPLPIIILMNHFPQYKGDRINNWRRRLVRINYHYHIFIFEPNKELEIQKIIHLQNLVNQLLDAFNHSLIL